MKKSLFIVSFCFLSLGVEALTTAQPAPSPIIPTRGDLTEEQRIIGRLTKETKFLMQEMDRLSDEMADFIDTAGGIDNLQGDQKERYTELLHERAIRLADYSKRKAQLNNLRRKQ